MEQWLVGPDQARSRQLNERQVKADIKNSVARAGRNGSLKRRSSYEAATLVSAHGVHAKEFNPAAVHSIHHADLENENVTS